MRMNYVELSVLLLNTDLLMLRITVIYIFNVMFKFKSLVKDSTSEFLSSSFSTGFLAAALRRWIIGRLRFADIISKLISTIPKILAISVSFDFSLCFTFSYRLKHV